MLRAVNPLDREAKHDFRADAGPIFSPMFLMLRTRISESERWCVRFGPEMQMEGFFQVPSSCRNGEPPIIPPSRQGSGIGGLSGSELRNGNDVERDLREGVFVLGSVDTWSMWEISFAVFEEIAFRSM